MRKENQYKYPDPKVNWIAVTPGWVTDSNGNALASVYPNSSKEIECRAANTLLIAAAPELLQALCDIVYRYEFSDAVNQEPINAARKAIRLAQAGRFTYL